MIALYILISLFIAWVWVDYFRMIDVFRKNEIFPTLVVFLLGAASPLLVLGLHRVFPDADFFTFGEDAIVNLLHCVFDIGMVEEISKLIPFLMLALMWRNHFDEPIDYVYFISISALGFSCFENVLYFTIHGPSIINGRSILSTVAHMFDTSIMAYGIVRHKFITKKWAFIAFPFYLFLASLSHGLYDYFLMQGSGSYFLLSILLFFLTVSIYSTVMNNCLNISQHFTYKVMVNQWKVIGRMLIYYLLIFVFQFSLLIFTEGTKAFRHINIGVFFVGFIIFVVVVRLSRFKLIRGRWNPIKIELPFTILSGSEFNPGRRLMIKGENFNEAGINKYYNEYFIAKPVTARRSFIETTKKGYIEEKVFADKDETYYVINLQMEENAAPKKYMIVPKKFGTTSINGKYPIVALLRVPEKEILPEKNDFSKIKFLEWVFLQPLPVTK